MSFNSKLWKTKISFSNYLFTMISGDYDFGNNWRIEEGVGLDCGSSNQHCSINLFINSRDWSTFPISNLFPLLIQFYWFISLVWVVWVLFLWKEKRRIEIKKKERKKERK